MTGAAVVLLASVAVLGGSLVGPGGFGGSGVGWDDPGPDGHTLLVERLSSQAALRVVVGSIGSIPAAAGAGDVLFLFPTHRAAAVSEAERLEDFVAAGGTVVVATDGGHANSWASGLGAMFHGQPVLLAPGAERDCVETVVQLLLAHALCLPSPSAMPDLEDALVAEAVFQQVAKSGHEVFLDLDGDQELSLADQGPGHYPVVAAWQLGQGTVWVIADGDLWRNGVVTERQGHLEFAAGLAQGADTIYLDSTAGARSGLGHLAVPLYRALGGLTTNDLAAVALMLVAAALAVSTAPRTTRWAPHEWKPAEDPELEAEAAHVIAQSNNNPTSNRSRIP